MKAHRESIPYTETGYLSKIITDYINQDTKLTSFYTHPPTLKGILAALEARQRHPVDRQLLYDVLMDQYKKLELSPSVAANLELIESETTFTVTTAHQPNIFTGPLYFIYKILHAIKLAETLREKHPEFDFVPVYYMGSEDADLEELGHIFLNGQKVSWQTEQLGAVGRMKTTGLDAIIWRLEGEFVDEKAGQEMVDLCRNAYLKHENIQTATFYLVNELFGKYGLVTLIPDHPQLKKPFNTIVKKELTAQFSYPLVQQSIEALSETYEVQAAGRQINLFYLADDGSRERIERIEAPAVAGEIILSDDEAERFRVVNTEKIFSQREILEELTLHPERFSANVILRGLFQETILPNIAFIGGGGELAYWLELKKVFEAAEVPFPVLLLRNSFLLVEPKNKALLDKLGIAANALFDGIELLKKALILRVTSGRLDTRPEQELSYKLYEQLQEVASQVDPTLKAHIAALHARTHRGLLALEKKFLRAEKRKHGDLLRQLEKVHGALFPNGSLQERVDNFMPLYARYGRELIDLLHEHSEPIAMDFTMLHLP